MSDDATARNIVDLAMDDKPNKAGDVMNDILLDKIGQHVQDMKAEISNDMFGQELPEPDAEPVEVQPELDLEPNEEEDETYEADQEIIDEPDNDSDVETDPEESEEEEEQ
jgi:hypothetical protein